MSVERDVIQVVLAVYDPEGTYSRHAGVVMTSLFSNTQSMVCVTILHDETLTDENRHRFEKTAKRWQQCVNFINVSEYVAKFVSDPDKEGQRFSRGTLYRLVIPDLLNVPKVIYLDSDIVVNMDIKELWELPLGDAVLAAVKSWQHEAPRSITFHDKLKKWIFNFQVEKQFCAGVLLMNLQRIREKHNFLEEAVFHFKRYGFACDFADEDFLHRLYVDETLLVDSRFDCFDGNGNVENRIIHLAAHPKPWKYPLKVPEHVLYWKVFMSSEWRDQLPKAIADIALEVYKAKTIEHFHSIDCLKCVLKRIPRHLFGFCWKNNLFIILKELHYRFIG